MNWKAEAIERLRRYDTMKAALQNIQDELSQLEEEAAAIKSVKTDKIAVMSSPDAGDALMNNLVRKEELRHALKQAKLWVKITERALGMLLPEERLILHRLYISREREVVERLCQELGYEQSSVYRKKDQALLRFTRALYGFADSQKC